MILFRQLICTFFLMGKLPKIPGTWGSLGALIIWVFIPFDLIIRLSLIIVATVLGYIFIKAELQTADDPDPSYIVIDEVVGMWIALLFVPLNIVMFAAAFILFRIFDILKPSFIYSVQYLHGPTGVLLDDIIAGILVSLIMLGLSF